MARNFDDRSSIRRYLLNQLIGEAQQEIERRLLTEDEMFDQLQAAEDDLVDEYLAGSLTKDEGNMFEKHFLATAERQQKLRFAKAFQKYVSNIATQQRLEAADTARDSWNWRTFVPAFPLRVAAFAGLIVLASLGGWRILLYQSAVDRGLIALNSAYREQRPVEARITHFDYAPFVVTRGPGTAKFNERELKRAELTLLDALNNNPTPAVHHALGKVDLAKRDFSRAIERFEEALKGDSANAQLYSDLGAAYLEIAKIELDRGRPDGTNSESGKGMEDLVRSVEASRKALQINRNLLEALFNRALAYEEMVLPEQAEQDWKKYLENDQNSKWANEARAHLTDLEGRKKARSQNKAEILTEFIAAYKSNSDDKAYDLLSKNTEAITGQLLWWQIAEAYLDAALKTQGANAAQSYLEALRYAGQLQEKKAGDRFISELTMFYRSCSLNKLSAIARAHAMINEAHVLMIKSEAAEALKLYQKAKVALDNAGNKLESLYVVYWIAYCYQRISRIDVSLEVLSQLAEDCQSRDYLWLLEKAVMAIGGIRVDLNQFSVAIAYQTQSLQISEKINDAYNIQRSLAVLAYGYKNLGNRQQSLAYIYRCLNAARSWWPGARQMYRNYYTVAGILNSFGYYAAAGEYEKAALQLAKDEADPVLQNQSYVALAAISAKLKDHSQALHYAELSLQAAKMVDERTTRRPTGDSFLMLGHVHRHRGDYPAANTSYNEAIRLYSKMGLSAFLYEAHKGRLLSYISQNNDLLAKEELQTVLSLFEQNRSRIIEEKNRNSFFDLEQYVYDIAIDFEYSRSHDSQKAFEYSEVSRARSLFDLIHTGAEASNSNNPDIVISAVSQPLTLSGIRERMPANVQILQYAVLDDKLLAWVISREKFDVAEEKITSSSLTEKVLNYNKSVSSISESENDGSRRASVELYEILIKPVESLLEKDKQIFIVPDKALNSLPFNALISSSTGKYLISDYQLSFAPSSNVFVAASVAARQRSHTKDERLLSVGDPHFDRDAFPDLPDLPSSRKEAEEIADYYKSSCLLVGQEAKKERVKSEMEKADVIHIASHYVIDEHNPMLSKLLLTKVSTGVSMSDSSDGILQTYEICKRKLPIARLVALSACQTGVERYYSGEGMIGMSRTFLAAGVPLVAGSLWPVASDATTDLMTSFHRYRKRSNLSTAHALRQAQLDMLNNLGHPHSRPYYWAPFVLIGGYASF